MTIFQLMIIIGLANTIILGIFGVMIEVKLDKIEKKVSAILMRERIIDVLDNEEIKEKISTIKTELHDEDDLL